MAKLLSILLVGLLFEAIGVVLLSRGLKEIGELQQLSVSGVAQLVARGMTNLHIVLGVFFEALFFITLLMLMSRAEVSFVWPLTSLSFVFATVAAKVYLNEHVSPLRWSGVCLIMVGAAVITWTEKNKSPAPSIPTVTRSSGQQVLPPQ